MMEIKVHTRGLNYGPKLEEHVNKKLDRLGRYLPNIMTADLELSSEGRSNQPVAQLTIRNKRGMIFRAEDKKQQDMFSAVDAVVDKMSRQIRQYKTKQRRKGKERWSEAVDPELIEISFDEAEPEAAEEVVESKIIRRKDVILTPMNEDEAVEQLELLGHDFFVFLNGDTGHVGVVYKRQDGNFGVLNTQTS
ncbi:MAG: ribosome-associated translation inhibitor RaiA [Chloroflexi bacterium]|nr:ribosome-associated translation inhibitor RaiA [Chloroflexota bacterium]